MSRRPARFTETEIRRIIKIAREERIPVRAIVIRPDGIALETTVEPEAIDKPRESVF